MIRSQFVSSKIILSLSDAKDAVATSIDGDSHFHRMNRMKFVSSKIRGEKKGGKEIRTNSNAY